MTEILQHDFPTQLQREFETLLTEGSYLPGTVLNLEKLPLHFSASSVDLSRVLGSSFRKGLLDHLPDGSYMVLKPAKPSIESVFQHTARMGFKPTTQVRELQIIPSNPEIAHRLKLQPGEPVYHQIRSRFVDGNILANQHNYLPIEVCPGLESRDLSHRSFQETLEQDYHAVVIAVEENCRLARADQEDREMLKLAANEDVIIVNRLSLSATRQPLVWADIHIRIDRIDYVAALWPNAAQLINDKKERNIK